jgi:hypothetical protein
VYENAGAGIRLGGDGAADGINNQVYGNVLEGNRGAALKVMRLPQGLICGNAARNNAGGVSREPSIQNGVCP